MAAIIIAGVLVAVAAAGDGPADAGAPAPGTISLQGSVVLGQQGKVILAIATPDEGGPSARACWPVDSNAFVFPYTVMTELPQDNPCGGPTDEAVLAPGVYTITVGVYQGGSQTPDRQVVLQIPVDGDEFPTFDGIALSVNPPGDANCDYLVDSRDVALVLGAMATGGAGGGCLENANVICNDALGVLDALALLVFQAVGTQTMVPVACPQLLAPPVLVSPADGAVFDIFPRDTPLDWEEVPGAASYVVQQDLNQSCYPHEGWCSEAGWGRPTFSGLTESELVLVFGSRGVGRWRVAAMGADGSLGPFSEWRTFEHLQ